MVLPMFFSESLDGATVDTTVELGGAEGKHAATVRRMRVGEGIQLTNGKGLRVIGTVSEVGTAGLKVLISETTRESLPSLQLSLVQALAKGDRDELAVQAATELGAIEIVPWQAARSISRWEGSKASKGRERWQVIATEAAKQSLRSFIPNVSEVQSSKQLKALLDGFDLVLVLDPTSPKSISNLDGLTGRVAIVVGPEGGIADEELKEFKTSGFTPVNLGKGVLRTSTAGLAAIAYLLGAGGYWG